MKKKGFALIEVMFALFFSSGALLTFFSFINHLFFITSKSDKSIKEIISSPIIFYYIPSNEIFDKKEMKDSLIDKFEFQQEKNLTIEKENYNSLYGFHLKENKEKINKNSKYLVKYLFIKNEKNENAS